VDDLLCVFVRVLVHRCTDWANTVLGFNDGVVGSVSLFAWFNSPCTEFMLKYMRTWQQRYRIRFSRLCLSLITTFRVDVASNGGGVSEVERIWKAAVLAWVETPSLQELRKIQKTSVMLTQICTWSHGPPYIKQEHSSHHCDVGCLFLYVVHSHKLCQPNFSCIYCLPMCATCHAQSVIKLVIAIHEMRNWLKYERDLYYVVSGLLGLWIWYITTNWTLMS
jgi:hypothetical protein